MSKKKVPTKAETFNKEKAEQTVKAASNVSIESAVKKLTDVNLTIGKTLNEVGQEISQQVQEFQDISAAVTLKEKELENLHEKELVILEVETLEQNRIDLEQSFVERKKELEELFTRERAQREYDFHAETRRQTDELNEAIRVKKLEERNRQDELERSWKRREEALSEREAEVSSLKAQVNGFDARLADAASKAVGETSNALKKEYEHRIQLLEMSKATDAQIAASTIKSLTEANSRLQSQLASAENRIAEAEKNIKSIAEKALEVSGSQKTLSEMQLMQNSPNGSSRSKQA